MQRIGRRPRALGLFPILFFFGVTSAESQDLNALFTSSTNLINSKSEGTTTDLQSFQQTLDLNWNRAISPTLRYRLTLRTQDSRNRTEVDSDLTRSSATRFEPIFDATLSSGVFSLNGGLRLRELITDGNKEDRIRLSERRWFTRLFLTPENLPSLSFQVDRFDQKNDLKPKSVDKADTRYQLGTDYSYKDFTFSYLFSKQINENFVSGQTRDQLSHLGTLGYSRPSLWGWLDVLGGYTINYTPTRTEFSSSGIAELGRSLSRGLRAAADLSPENSSDVPLTNEPGLIGGTALVPLELNISVGFEQAVSEPVSQIRLNLSPEPPFTIPNNLELFLNFRVFFTNDVTLTTWTELGGVSQNYNSLESRFELNFPSTTARFFKVYVSRNDFGALIRATGISAFNLEPVSAGTTRTESTLLHNLNGSFTVRPVTRPWTISTLAYDFFLTQLTQQPDSRRNLSGTHTVRLVAEPHRLLTSTFNYQHSFANSNQSGSKDTTFDVYSLVFSSTPLPTLNGSVTLTHTENRGDGKPENRSDSGTMNVSARLYRNLDLDSTFALARSQDFLNDQKTLSQSGTFNANAWLTPTLNATLGYSIRWAETERPDEQTSDLTHTINSSFTYTLSRFLNINTRYDLLKGNDVTSFSQGYRVDWSPTSKLSAFLGYRRTQQQANGERTGSDNVNFNGRWNISRYFNLDGNFVFFRTFDGNRVYSFSASAQFRF